ncbi:MAG: MoaD/ThiS family protein [Gemmatimonadetes bacterium]|nr:MoaD/ThiS family protein [Gemmatimonadota bacterium]
MIPGRRRTGATIHVEAVVQGPFVGRYRSVVASADLPEGATVRDLLDALRRSGELDAEAHAALRGVPPPLLLLINGDSVCTRNRHRTVLRDGDRVSLLVLVPGG